MYLYIIVDANNPVYLLVLPLNNSIIPSIVFQRNGQTQYVLNHLRARQTHSKTLVEQNKYYLASQLDNIALIQ